jgi:hypothetical protein
VLGDDGQDRAGGEGGVGVLQREDDLAVAARPDLLDGVQLALEGVVGLRVEGGPVRVDDVGGRQGLTVAELDPVAQRVGVRAATAGDLRQSGRQRGLQLQVGVVGEEPVEDLGVAVLAVAEERAEGAGFGGHPEHDGPCGCAVARAAAAGGRTGGDRRGQRRRGGGPSYPTGRHVTSHPLMP